MEAVVREALHIALEEVRHGLDQHHTGASPQARPRIEAGLNWRSTNSSAAPWSGWMERRGRNDRQMWMGASLDSPVAGLE